MERSDELKDKIGAVNIGLLIENIENGTIKLQKVIEIGLQMDKKVNGVFEYWKHEELRTMMLFMLDKWWEVKLHIDDFDAVQELKRIFIEVGLPWLAKQVTPRRM